MIAILTQLRSASVINPVGLCFANLKLNVDVVNTAAINALLNFTPDLIVHSGFRSELLVGHNNGEMKSGAC